MILSKVQCSAPSEQGIIPPNFQIRYKSADFTSLHYSWEQGTAAAGVLELDNPDYSVFASNPFVSDGTVPVTALNLAFSAAVRQGPDGRLSQEINDGEDGAALDGASSGPYTLLGEFDLSHTARDAYFFLLTLAKVPLRRRVERIIGRMRLIGS